MSDISNSLFEANGRTYSPPAKPVVVICIDGCADEYLSTAMVLGRMPNVSRMLAAGGYRGLVRAALPTFTNVNNAAIVTGVPPKDTGISGNYFIDPESGEESMMNSSRFLRCGTLLAAAAAAGRKVAFVTAKDKLREILSKGMEGISFSSEKADEARRESHGIEGIEEIVGKPKPPIYSAEASLYVLDGGVALLEKQMADFFYLSLTDFMQHKFAPADEPALAFYEGIDARIGRFLDLGAVVAATADHGMNSKTGPDGSPNILFLESMLEDEFGDVARVICPITDPYVVHHGALGSLVMVHISDRSLIQPMAHWILSQTGITEVYTRDMAARKLELPADRIGDLTVMCGRDWVIGKTPEHHDLSKLDGKLRSHGGRYEEMVPMLLSAPLTPAYAARAAADPRNFDIFDFACNGLA